MNPSRSRLACASCTRRKVKCSKTVPCSNCIRRGEQSTCRTSQDGMVTVTNAEQPASIASSPPSPQSISSPTDVRDESELSMLRRRVAELENELQHVPSPSPSPTEQVPTAVSHRRPGTRTEAVHRRAENRQRAPSCDTVAEDAASILEFLAWGRRKNPDLPVTSPEAVIQVSPVGDVLIAPTQSDLAPNDIGSLDDVPQMSILQLLLPDYRRTWDLVLWHEQCLLWYHCSYHAPSLRNQLENFYDKYEGSIQHPEVNLQWVAFLFAVLAGSITAFPPSTAEKWGFNDAERDTLSKRWFQAAITCLNRADFASNHSILSIQAIATLTLSAHMLGFSNLQSTYLAASVRIAQSLGFHRLTETAFGGEVEKEAGRRAWLQICCQDWFSLPFSDTYLINPAYSKSALPLNCHDEDLAALPDSVPTVAGYSRFLGSIASIMPRLQDGLVSCNTLFTKYEQVLKWDKQLRTIATATRPKYLASGPLNPDWPIWVHWARRSLAISSSHKIIMIHRSFLSRSFSNPAFAFTRKTCLAASKTIIKEYKCVVEEDGPVLWIYQAFAVAASIILILDLLHSERNEPHNAEHFQLVHDIIEILAKCRNSTIAARGVKILTALLEEASATMRQGRKRASDGDNEGPNPQPAKRARLFNVPAFVKSFCDDQKTPVPQSSQPQPLSAHPTELADHFLDSGPFDEGSIENLFYLASQDFYA
ncbi:c6 zinc finger domain-containing protein [Dactylonectria estremocensis]|uniref:C6 zinc finger domain-containing protein n=1 Tax=Dactylonectria estremocensis TaxID=1079267 RepID=A0A9P9DMV3_9HYPO|nr:c6 zinc finger domain-containing protein [Dactylonectria estremocensis]